MAKRRDCWEATTKVLKTHPRPVANVLLHGPCGTGKSYAAQTAGVPTDRPAVVLNMTEDTGSAELRGFFGLEDGKFRYLPGPMLLAWRHGARLVINEIDKCGPEARATLLGFADDPEVACQTLTDGTTERPREGFHIVATSNAPPESLDSILRDRFPIAIHIDQVHPEALRVLPPELRSVAANTAIIEDEARRVSIRSWAAFAKLILSENLADAARMVFADRTDDVLAALKIAGYRP